MRGRKRNPFAAIRWRPPDEAEYIRVDQNSLANGEMRLSNLRQAFLNFAFPVAAILQGCASTMTSRQEPVTLAIFDGIVWTGEPSQPWAEAVAMSGDRIT